MSVANVTDSTFEQEVLKADIPVLVDFWAPWCGPCKMMAPILTEVKETLGDSVTIIKIDVDKNQSLMASPQFQLRGVPTLMLFKEGKVLWKQAGVVPKEEIVSRIKSFC